MRWRIQGKNDIVTHLLDFPNDEVKRGFITMLSQIGCNFSSQTGTIDGWEVK